MSARTAGAGVAAGTERLADGLALVLAEVDDGPDAAMVVLENSPGSGFGLGVDVAELAGIAEAAAARGLPSRRIGFCLDTAHAWAAGIDVVRARRRSMRSWPISTSGSGSTGW